MKKRTKNITEKVTQAAVVEGSLKTYEYMMQQNRGCIVEEGRREHRTTKRTKIPKK